MPHHRLSLCRDHYLDWFIEQTEKTIHHFHMVRKDERILVAVSGGKDSLALWDVLARLGYLVDGLYIDLGIDENIRYSAQSRELAQSFAVERGLNLRVFDVRDEFGQSIPEMIGLSTRGEQRACSLCGLIKRRVFNTAAREGGYQAIATGHNLDDEVAVLFSNNLSWTLDQLRRQEPVLPETEFFARKIKPFCRLYERETAAYTLMRGIEYVEDECPFAVGSNTNYYKTLFNQLERDRPGSKLFYYTRFLQEKQAGFLREAENQPVNRNVCPTCGEPTTSTGQCALCRVLDRVHSGAG
jgi:uncharacterized protein (TIGR00269 family)